MKILKVAAPKLEIAWPDDVEVVEFDEHKPIPAEHRDAEAAILWGGAGNMQRVVDQLPNVRWFQTFTAGPDALLRAEMRDDIVITNGRNFHDRPVAEHALAMALYLVRRFGAITREGIAHRWESSHCHMAPLHDGVSVRTLIDSKVVIWGFGQIGQQIARVFSACGSRVVGVARSAGERAGFPVITEDDMIAELADTDILVMVLPNTPDTADALNAKVLSALPRRAFVVNVGRGTTIDEDALMEALHSGRLAGAAIDVAKTEPLPEDSPLWETPNLLVTPHCAGFRPDGAPERILHNLKALREGKLEDMIGVIRAPKN